MKIRMKKAGKAIGSIVAATFASYLLTEPLLAKEINALYPLEGGVEKEYTANVEVKPGPDLLESLEGQPNSGIYIAAEDKTGKIAIDASQAKIYAIKDEKGNIHEIEPVSLAEIIKRGKVTGTTEDGKSYEISLVTNGIIKVKLGKEERLFHYKQLMPQSEVQRLEKLIEDTERWRKPWWTRDK